MSISSDSNSEGVVQIVPRRLQTPYRGMALAQGSLGPTALISAQFLNSAIWIAGQCAEHTAKVQDKARHNQETVTGRHDAKPKDRIEELALVELSEPWNQETQNGRDSRIPFRSMDVHNRSGDDEGRRRSRGQ